MQKRAIGAIEMNAHIGYFLLFLPGLYWFGALLYSFGVSAFESFYENIPNTLVLIIIVFIPTLTLLLGAFDYVRRPREKRKLAYQSLMALSVAFLLLFMISMIDGSLM